MCNACFPTPKLDVMTVGKYYAFMLFMYRFSNNLLINHETRNSTLNHNSYPRIELGKCFQMLLRKYK